MRNIYLFIGLFISVFFANAQDQGLSKSDQETILTVMTILGVGLISLSIYNWRKNRKK